MLKQLIIGLLFQGIGLFILVVGAVFGAWKIYRNLSINGPKALKAQRKAHLFPTYVNKSHDMQSMMVAEYVGIEENNDYYRRNDSRSYALDHFLEKLDFDRSNGPFKIEAANRLCDFNEHRCTTLYRLTVAYGEYEGQIVYLTNENWHNNTHYHNKQLESPRERYEFANNDKEFLEDYYFRDEDKESVLNVGASTHILVPNTLPPSSDPIVALKEILKSSVIRQKQYPDEAEGKSFTRMFYLHDDGEHISLKPKTVVGKALSDAQIDALYQPFEVTYQNEKHKVKASAMVGIMAMQLYHGNNVFLNGVLGTGKTSFMQLVMNELSYMEDTVIVNVMPSLIRGLKNLRAQTQFTDALGNIIEIEQNTRVVVFLDEGESMMAKTSEVHSEDNTFIASLLDGEVKKIIKCSVAITFNANPKDLNPILFRSGRAQMVTEVKPIPKNEASLAVRAMKASNIDKLFDEARYNHYVDSSNKTADGKEYCPPGYITLADISGCFIEKDVASLLIEAIRGESMNLDAKPRPSKTPPPPPPAKKAISEVATQSINDKMRALRQKGEI